MPTTISSPIGHRRNADDVFVRDLTICVLDTLEGEITWNNRFSDKTTLVTVPFNYSMTGDERMVLDSFTDDVVSQSRFVDTNTDKIPRAIVTLASFDIKSDEAANPHVYMRVSHETDESVKEYLAKVRPIPIEARYSVSIMVSSEIDAFKCIQSIMDSLWYYRFMYFEYQHMPVDAYLGMPDDRTVEINREKNMSSKDEIKINFDIVVKTYYPAWKKPMEAGPRPGANSRWANAYNFEQTRIDPYDEPLAPRRTRWYLDLLAVTGRNVPNNNVPPEQNI